MNAIVEMTGTRFGSLVVQAKSTERRHGQVLWVCKCDCGASTTVLGANLRKGNTTSCGCVRLARCAARLRKHGGSEKPEFQIWCGIKKRCNNPRDKRYARYGGRGIRICLRWENSFENFLADIGPRPSPSHTVERDDNDGHYEPGNCRWATLQEQANNRSSNHYIEHDGHRLSLIEWSRRTGLNRSTIRRRLKAGKTPAETLSCPNPEKQKAAKAG